MMTPLCQRILELDVSATALAQMLGRTERADSIRGRIKDLRVAAGKVVLAELATKPQQIDPAEAVRLVIDQAISAGLSWTDVAAIFNTASDRRAE